MNDLEKKVNDYINNNLLNFNNFPELSLNKENLKDEVLRRLLLKRYSKKAQFEEAIEWLVSAGPVIRIYDVTKPEHPLKAFED